MQDLVDTLALLDPILELEINELIRKLDVPYEDLQTKHKTLDFYIDKFLEYKDSGYLNEVGFSQTIDLVLSQLKKLKYPEAEDWLRAFEHYKQNHGEWISDEKLIIEVFRAYGGLDSETAELIFDSYIEEYERYPENKKIFALFRMYYFQLRGRRFFKRFRWRVNHGELGFTVEYIRERFKKIGFLKNYKPSEEDVLEFIRTVYNEAVEDGIVMN